MGYFLNSNYFGVNMDTKIYTLGALGALFAMSTMLTSCGGGGSTSNPDDPITSNISGQASDGYLSGATVFLDINNNRVYDNNEPSTTTDSNGNYSLTYDDSLEGNIVAVTGGTDTATGKAFNAILEAPLYGEVVNINPISNLVAKKVLIGKEDVASARAAIAQSLGLDADDVAKDPISEQAKNGNNSIIAAALAVQKTIEDLANAAQAADSSLSLANVVDDIATNLAIEADSVNEVNSFDELIQRAVASTKTGATTLPLAVKKSTHNAKKRFNAVKNLVSQVGENKGSTATTAISNIQKLVEQDIDFAREQVYENANFVIDDTSTFAIDIKAATNTALADLVDESFIENKVVEIVIEAKTQATDSAVVKAITDLDSFDINNLLNDKFLEDLQAIVDGEVIIAGINTVTFATIVNGLEKDKNEELNEAKERERETASGNFTFPTTNFYFWTDLELDYNATIRNAYIAKILLRSSDNKVVNEGKYYEVGTHSFTTIIDSGSPTFTWDETDNSWVNRDTGLTYQIIDNKVHLNNGVVLAIDYATDISGERLYYNGVTVAQMPKSYASINEIHGGSIEYGTTYTAEDILYVAKIFAESNPYTSLGSFIKRRCADLDKAVRKYDSDNDNKDDIAITFVSNGTLTSTTASDGQICGYENGNTQTGTIALYELDNSGSMTTLLDENFGSWERKKVRDKDSIVVSLKHNLDFDSDSSWCPDKKPLFSMKKLNASTDTAVVWSGNLVNCEDKSVAYSPVAAKAIRGKTKAKLNGIQARSDETGLLFTKDMLAGKTLYHVERIDTSGYRVFTHTFNAEATEFTATLHNGNTATYAITLDNFILADKENDSFTLVPISKKTDSSGNIQYYKVFYNGITYNDFGEWRMFDSLAKAQAYANAKNYGVKPIAGEEAFAFGVGEFAISPTGTTSFYIMWEDDDKTYDYMEFAITSQTTTVGNTQYNYAFNEKIVVAGAYDCNYNDEPANLAVGSIGSRGLMRLDGGNAYILSNNGCGEYIEETYEYDGEQIAKPIGCKDGVCRVFYQDNEENIVDYWFTDKSIADSYYQTVTNSN